MPLYPYQERVKKLLYEGKSVILQAPTGAGKTRAALAPFIEAFFEHPPDSFPRKCIYSVPMKVLANQFQEEYLSLTRKYQRIHRREISVSIQTGDRPEDNKFESNLIFTTIDQTLSNYLSTPYGLGKRLANLNAGAVLSSYLVFDELHLYDPDSTLPTTLTMLRDIRKITPFIVMTATFSSQMLGRLANLLDAVVVPESQDARVEMESIGSQVGKNRRFYAIDNPLSTEQVLKNLAPRTVCICNTVAHAQKLYADIQSSLEEGKKEIEVSLLHSRFYKDDRDKKEKEIKKQFGTPQNEYQGSDRILIATQVIEVGLDITCDVMHTEISPASSLLQRSGRNARRAGEKGKVFVYLPRNDKGEADFTPYYLPPRKKDDDKKRPTPPKTERGLRLCQGTWDALNSKEFTDIHMSFQKEQALIDQVHQEVDKEILDSISYSEKLLKDKMLEVMASCERGKAAELIRNVRRSIFAFLHASPEKDENLSTNPWYYDGFSLSPGQLYRLYKNYEEGNLEIDGWAMFWGQRIDGNAESYAYNHPEYVWTAVQEAGEIYQHAMIAIHPKLVHYSQELGLWLDEKGEIKKPRKRTSGKRPYPNFVYKKETYTEHIQGLYQAYISPQENLEKRNWFLPLKDETAFTAARLEKQLKLPPDTLNKMLRALFVLHDLGKLDVRWQAWAHQWQEKAGQFFGQDLSIADDYMAAHTDYDGRDEKQKKAQKTISPKRPNHAGESAIAAIGVLDELCAENEDLWKAAFTALARHHSPLTESYGAFKFHPIASKELESAFSSLKLDIGLKEKIMYDNVGKESFDLGLIHFENTTQRTLYFFFVRILRLADQRSQI